MRRSGKGPDKKNSKSQIAPSVGGSNLGTKDTKMKDVDDFNIPNMVKVKEDVVEALGFFKQPEGKEFLGLCGSFLHKTSLGPKSAIVSSAQKSKDTKETNPSSTSKITITKESMREMLEHASEWQTLVEAFNSDEFS